MNPDNFKVILSQLGYDVGSLSDINVLFSSDFRIPLIVLEGTVAGNGTVNHNLGYAPFVMSWVKTNTSATGGFDPGFSTTITKTQITYGYSSSYTIKYRIYAIDIGKAFQAKSLRSPAAPFVTSGVKDMVLKVAKAGKDVSSKDLRDLNLDSSTRSIILHQVLTGACGTIASGDYAGVHGYKFVPDLPYHPIYFPFWSQDAITWKPLNGMSQSPPKINIDSTDNNPVINAGGKTGDYYSIVTFKEPLDYGVSNSVTL